MAHLPGAGGGLEDGVEPSHRLASLSRRRQGGGIARRRAVRSGRSSACWRDDQAIRRAARQRVERRRGRVSSTVIDLLLDCVEAFIQARTSAIASSPRCSAATTGSRWCRVCRRRSGPEEPSSACAAGNSRALCRFFGGPAAQYRQKISEQSAPFSAIEHGRKRRSVKPGASSPAIRAWRPRRFRCAHRKSTTIVRAAFRHPGQSAWSSKLAMSIWRCPPRAPQRVAAAAGQPLLHTCEPVLSRPGDGESTDGAGM